MNPKVYRALTLTALTAALWCFASPSQAMPILLQGNNRFNFISVENEYGSVANAQAGTSPITTPLVAGDILQGVIYATSDNGGILSPGTNSQQITGMYSLLVTSGANGQLGFTASGAFATGSGYANFAGLGDANTALMLFTSPVNTFNTNIFNNAYSSLAAVYTDAQAGSVLGAFTTAGSPAASWFSNGTNFWYSLNLETLPSFLNTSASVLPQVSNILNPQPLNQNPNAVALYGAGNLGLNTGPNYEPALFGIQSTDPANLAVNLVPEPSSIMLLTVGLSFIGAWSVRRRRKAQQIAA